MLKRWWVFALVAIMAAAGCANLGHAGGAESNDTNVAARCDGDVVTVDHSGLSREPSTAR